MIAFTIPGQAQPWRRARTRGGLHFKDAKTRANQSRWEGAAFDAMRGKPPLDGPLHVIITARFMPPKGASKRLREAMLSGDERPAKRPDLDNIVKNLDGLNGIAFRDDAQVVQLSASKVYAESAGVDVTIVPLTHSPEAMKAAVERVVADIVQASRMPE